MSFFAKGSPQSLSEPGWHHPSADQHPLIQKYTPDIPTLKPRSWVAGKWCLNSICPWLPTTRDRLYLTICA